MLDDIRPPKNKNRPPLPSHGSRGYSLDHARQRLSESKVSPDNPISDSQPPQEAITPTPEKNTPRPAKKQRFTRWRKLKGRWSGLSRNKRFAIISAALLIFGAGALAYYYFILPQPNPSIQITKTTKPESTTVASPLTGLQVSPEAAARPVTGIMIENSLDARPQAGIDQAGVIFEAIAEGGITRFLTLYQDAQPQYVGPVRSLRPYYLDWLVPFDASIAHVGGSSDALAQVRDGMKDLDQFFNAGSYWRVSSRAAPHNLFTSFEKLDALNKSKGYTTSKVASFTRKTDSKLAVPTAKAIGLAISSSNFNAHYDYDAASNSYLRSEGGAPHKAIASAADQIGQQLHPKVVIALIIPYSVVDRAGHSGYDSSGSGQLYVFQDGGVTQGTWTKANRASQFSFADSNGAPIKLNTGQTWLTALGNASMVSYTP